LLAAAAAQVDGKLVVVVLVVIEVVYLVKVLVAEQVLKAHFLYHQDLML
jgi:hypothetical protein